MYAMLEHRLLPTLILHWGICKKTCQSVAALLSLFASPQHPAQDRKINLLDESKSTNTRTRGQTSFCLPEIELSTAGTTFASFILTTRSAFCFHRKEGTTSQLLLYMEQHCTAKRYNKCRSCAEWTTWVSHQTTHQGIKINIMGTTVIVQHCSVTLQCGWKWCCDMLSLQPVSKSLALAHAAVPAFNKHL